METDYQVSARAGSHQFQEGYRINNTLGSYIHLHFGSSIETAETFVENCRNYRLERK